jgi:inorganic pyrophosphatase
MKSLSSPDVLKPILKKEGVLQVVVETPSGSRNKFAYDPDLGVFSLKKLLPAGMTFPYDFGFLPQTSAQDGDPIDVLLLMEEPTFSGCIVRARLIGVIQGEQTDGKNKERNDRLLAVAEASHVYSNVKNFKDLPAEWIKELEAFFVHYHKLEGKEYRMLGCKGTDEAFQSIKDARDAA